MSQSSALIIETFIYGLIHSYINFLDVKPKNSRFNNQTYMFYDFHPIYCRIGPQYIVGVPNHRFYIAIPYSTTDDG